MAHPAKKILILYASAGHGHEKAAKAILEAVREDFPGYTVAIADVIAYMPMFFSVVYRETYLLQIQYTPWLWGFFYHSFDIGWFYAFLKFVRRGVNGANSHRLVKYLIAEQADVVITTHFFATEVVSHLRTRKVINSKLLTVVTDYEPHYVWTAKNSDLYAVALPETKTGLQARGVPADRIEVTGIPTENKFLVPVDVKAVRERLGFEDNVFTVLLTSGGVGIASIEDIVKGLVASKESLQVLIVCGTNKTLLQKIQKTYSREPRVKPLGFVTNMNELMEISDVVVGKAGGLTITESFLKSKPVVLYRSIPGQESRNVAMVLRHGAGYATNSAVEVVQMIRRLGKSPEEMKTLRKSASQIARPDASKAITQLAHELCLRA